MRYNNMNLLLTLICSTFFHFSIRQHKAVVEWKSDCVENRTWIGCHFGGDQVENSLRAAIIQAVKDLCVRNEDKTRVKTTKKRNQSPLQFMFLFFLSVFVRKYLSISPRLVWPLALWELPGNREGKEDFNGEQWKYQGLMSARTI